MLATCGGFVTFRRYIRRFVTNPPRELAIARVGERQHNLIHLSQPPSFGLTAQYEIAAEPVCDIGHITQDPTSDVPDMG
jgi:hypothetical protein